MKEPPTIVRVPLIPKFNADEKQITAISHFVRQAGGTMMELLPYHRYGKSKYRQIGRQYLLHRKREVQEGRARSVDPEHAWKHLTREPGGPASVCSGGAADREGKSKDESLR